MFLEQQVVKTSYLRLRSEVMAGRGGGRIVLLTTKISKCKFWVCVQFVCAKISLGRLSSP